MVNIETDRLNIRPMNKQELRELIESYRITVPELSMAYAEMLAACENYPEHFLWYTSWKMCRKEDGKEIGYAGFKGLQKDGSVEIGYGVKDAYQGHVYATEGTQALCQWALEQEGVSKVEAETEPNNTASQRVLEKNGFHPTGQVGEEGPRYVLLKK